MRAILLQFNATFLQNYNDIKVMKLVMTSQS